MVLARNVFAIYSNRLSAENGIRMLKKNGILFTDISMLMTFYQSSPFLSRAIPLGQFECSALEDPSACRWIQGIMGSWVGIGKLVAPDLPELLFCGPFMTDLAALNSDNFVESIRMAFIKLGIEEFESVKYEQSIYTGGLMIVIHSRNSVGVKRIMNCFKQTGARDVSTSLSLEDDIL